MAAWARAGVALPHFSAAQYTHGRHVGFADLEPGDLVFLYGDIHHVEMYVGGGLAISAPQEGEDIKFVRVADYRDVFYGATRLG
jgi:cell wall-associated NlpC family hydrolase